MSKNTIKLSPKHGLNPSMSMCFWCHQPTGDILIPGKIDKEDSEAPKYMVTSYEPCDNCKAQMNQGITLIGVTTEQPNDKRPPINEQIVNPDTNETVAIYPTGSCVTLKDTAVERIIQDVNTLTQLKANRKGFCSDQMIQDIINSCNGGAPDGEDAN